MPRGVPPTRSNPVGYDQAATPPGTSRGRSMLSRLSRRPSSQLRPKGASTVDAPIQVVKAGEPGNITPVFGPLTRLSDGTLPGQPAPTVPEAPSYSDLYAQALNKSRSGIEDQFRLAISDISSREKAAGAGLAQLPGQLADIYSQGAQQVSNATTSLDKAQAATGLGSYMSANDQLAPLQAANANSLAASQASVPLMQLAMQQEFSRQRGGASAARGEALSREDDRTLSDLASQRDSEAQSLSKMNDMRLNLEIEALRNADKYARQDEAANKKARNDLLLASAKEKMKVNKNTGLSFAEEDQLRGSRRYKNAVSGANRKKNKLSPKKLKELYGGQPKLWALLNDDIDGLAAAFGDE